MTLLDGATDAQHVRLLVDPTLTAAALPDATIYAPVFAGAVEASIALEHPDSATWPEGSPQLESYRRAAMYLTAEAIVSAGPTLASEKFADEYAVAFESGNAAARAAWLRQQARSELAQFNASSVPTVFTRASGRRGRGRCR